MVTFITRRCSKRKGFLILISLFLCITVIFRLLGEGPDFSNYKMIFSWEMEAEPFWFIVSRINLFLGNYYVTLFLITFISLQCKFKYYNYVEYKGFYTALIFSYCITFFLLHEYTQIRVSLALGLFFLCVPYIRKISIFKYFIFICLLMCIHYSAIIFFPLYFYIKIKRMSHYILIPLFLFLFDIIFVEIFREADILNKVIDFILLDNIGEVGETLKIKRGNWRENLSIYNKLYLMYFFILAQTYYICFYKKKITNQYQIFCYKCLSYSLSLFYLCCLTPYSIMTLRFSELFLPFSLPLLFYNLKLVKEKFFYSIFVFIAIILLSIKLQSVTVYLIGVIL